MQIRKRANAKEPKMDQSSRYKRSLPAYTMNLGGSGVRVNPLGLALLLFVGALFLYYTLSGGNSVGAGVGKYERFVSMKKLLAVSIEMAKRGGAEVKRIRTQARKKGSRFLTVKIPSLFCPIVQADLSARAPVLG